MVNSDNQRSIITTDLLQVTYKLPCDHGHDCTYIYIYNCIVYYRDVLYDLCTIMFWFLDTKDSVM